SLKMRLCNLPIDGAKCGINYDPYSPGKRQAMKKFMAAIKPYITTSYSMGPDLNTDMEELEAIAHELDIPSVKIAIAKTQGMDIASFTDRYAILQSPAIDSWPLGKVRAGYGVAMAALATLTYLNLPAKDSVIAVQGFGNLAKSTIVGLLKAGVNIRAIADTQKCYIAKAGRHLPLDYLLSHSGTLLPELSFPDHDVISTDKEAVLSSDCDILILAAVENVVTSRNAHQIRAKAIVPGANLAIDASGEHALFKKGILALPSFMAGCGGSLSMNGLFGPQSPPTPAEVLAYIEHSMTEMTMKVLSVAQTQTVTPSAAALEICNSAIVPLRNKPYMQTKA
nr:Glu/Leu/Phe/Val dehydrogenase [Desulfobulbaceae bacterium]